MREAYSKAAADPTAKHPFPLGRAFALEVGYPAELLDEMPPEAVARFTGVTDLSIVADLPPGATVLDLGCGTGLDAMIAARRVGKSGWVIGADFSEEMVRGAREAAKGIRNVEFICAAAEGLPLKDGSMDVVLANGILNLNPHRDKVLYEMHRVLAPGGAAYMAELLLIEPAAPASAAACDPGRWFS